MLTPNPLSLFCAIILCFPLALVLTITSNSNTIVIPSVNTHHHVILATSLSPPSQPPPPPPPPKPISRTPKTPSPPPKPISRTPKTPSLPSPKPISRTPKIPPLPPLKPITKTPKIPLKNFSSFTPPTNKTSSKKSIIKQIQFSPPPSSSPPPPPPVPEDDKDDVELLKRASRVNPNPTRGHPKKVAFLFLTTTPLPFAPLWELFFNQSGARSKAQYNIYIHADPTLQYDPPFTGVFSGRVIPSSKPTRRNSPTLITAARRLLAYALLDDPDNYMFTLISGACIPLHSFHFTYNTLVSSKKSFIEILSNESTAYGRWTARGEDVMEPEVRFEDFRVGSQFWSLTRRHARVVVGDVKLWRKFRLPCVTDNTCYPEENFFPTLLSMVDPRGVVPATLTNVNWLGQYDGHPRTYNASEVDPGLIQWLREGKPRYGDLGINGSDLSVIVRWDPFLFARKFAPNCVDPLLSIAKDVLFKD